MCKPSVKSMKSVYLEFYYFILFQMLYIEHQENANPEPLTWQVIDIASCCQSLCILTVQYLLKLHESKEQ